MPSLLRDLNRKNLIMNKFKSNEFGPGGPGTFFQFDLSIIASQSIL